jgi:hypothetical protein
MVIAICFLASLNVCPLFTEMILPYESIGAGQDQIRLPLVDDDHPPIKAISVSGSPLQAIELSFQIVRPDPPENAANFLVYDPPKIS